jgi:hypothetical protein
MAGWDPWAAAAGLPRLEIWFGDVPQGAVWHRDDEGDHITLDASASRRERRALLAHELIHVERGVGYPLASSATMQREEAIVRRETARRLVPPAELAALVARLEALEPITADLVADEFDVPAYVAAEALEALRQESAGPSVRTSHRA